MAEGILWILLATSPVLLIIAVLIKKSRSITKISSPVSQKLDSPTNRKRTYDSEALQIKKEFNFLIGSFLAIVLIQGIGVSSSIGRVLQELFGVSRFTSVFVVWLLALPLFLLLRGMQIMTNAILFDKHKN